MGGETAPVSSSGSAPAWTASVSNEGSRRAFVGGHGGMVARTQRDTFVAHVSARAAPDATPQGPPRWPPPLLSRPPTVRCLPARAPARAGRRSWRPPTRRPRRPLDTVGKWLVITRAAVFPMTIWSGLIGGLLAVEAARTERRGARRLGPVQPRDRRAGAVTRGQQHDQRLLRHDRRRGHRGLCPGAVRAAPDPVGLGDQGPAASGHPHRQCHRRRDHAGPGRRPRPLSSCSRWPGCSCPSSTSPRRSASSTTAWASPVCSSSGDR